MHVFLRKSPLFKEHFFEWLKTENFSNACGRGTLKSPPPRAFFTPHVHPRLRKHLSRCTLDCGLRFPEKPRTAGLCGRAARISDCGPLSCAKIERPSPLEKPSCKVRFFAQTHSHEYRQKVTATTLFPNRSSLRFQLLSQMAHVCFHRRKWVHTRLSEKDRTQRHTRRKRGRFGWGRNHYPRHVLHVHEHPRAGCQNGKLCRFGILAGRCSRRTQKAFGTAMCLCVSLSRRRCGPAGLRDLFATW